MTTDTRQPLLIANVKPVAFGPAIPTTATDILVGGDGKIAAIGAGLAAPADAERVDGKGAFVSPGWVDLHVHVWHGGTDISLRPSDCGAERGVTTMVDAGSAGEANFHGFREYVIEPARERIKAFLNLGSIGLVACNRVPELAISRISTSIASSNAMPRTASISSGSRCGRAMSSPAPGA